MGSIFSSSEPKFKPPKPPKPPEPDPIPTEVDDEVIRARQTARSRAAAAGRRRTIATSPGGLTDDEDLNVARPLLTGS